MALLNVHPDYVSFDGEQPSLRRFPVEKYREFLKSVREKHRDSFWQPLPREMAKFIAPIRPALPRRKANRRICMVTHSFYEADNRVTRYAEALAKRGDQVDIVALRRGNNIPREENLNGVNVFRLQTRDGKNQQKKLDYLFPLLRFLFVSSLWIARRHRKNPYDLIHVHNIPDFMVFAAWFPRLKGAQVLLDIHDIVPEFYSSKFQTERESPVVNTLKKVERISASFADHVILANHLWLDKYVSRSAAPGKCSVFINNVDSQVFQPRSRTRTDEKQIIIFPGGLQWHQGLDIAIRAFRKVTDRLPAAEFHIYGDGNMKTQLVALAKELQLNGKVQFFEPLRVREIAEVIANADLGVVPKRADSFGNEAYSTKIMEFMSVGVPVVVSETRIDRYYFDDTVVRFFESGNPDALADAMVEVLSNPILRQKLIHNATEYVAKNNWEARRRDYLALVDSLCECDGHRG
jgi:glycosyltransferase involved in cell wall biosynthesis